MKKCDYLAVQVARRLIDLGDWMTSIEPSRRGTCVVKAFTLHRGERFTVAHEFMESESHVFDMEALAAGVASDMHQRLRLASR